MDSVMCVFVCVRKFANQEFPIDVRVGLVCIVNIFSSCVTVAIQLAVCVNGCKNLFVQK